MYEGLASGEIDIMVGTHALIQEKTVFKNLHSVQDLLYCYPQVA